MWFVTKIFPEGVFFTRKRITNIMEILRWPKISLEEWDIPLSWYTFFLLRNLVSGLGLKVSYFFVHFRAKSFLTVSLLTMGYRQILTLNYVHPRLHSIAYGRQTNEIMKSIYEFWHFRRRIHSGVFHVLQKCNSSNLQQTSFLGFELCSPSVS